MTRDMQGRRVLVDIQAWRRINGPRYRDQNFTGIVVDITEVGIAVRRDDSGAVEEVAVAPEDFEVADADPYILRATGKVVPQPDYTIYLTQFDVLEVRGGGLGRDVSGDPDEWT